MGGVSGLVFGNTKAEVKENAKTWYYNCDKRGLFPRASKNDFPKDQDFTKDNIEFISIYTQEVPIQIIETVKIIKKGSFYRIYSKEDALKYKFCAVVSTHT